MPDLREQQLIRRGGMCLNFIQPQHCGISDTDYNNRAAFAVLGQTIQKAIVIKGSGFMGKK